MRGKVRRAAGLVVAHVEEVAVAAASVPAAVERQVVVIVVVATGVVTVVVTVGATVVVALGVDGVLKAVEETAEATAPGAGGRLLLVAVEEVEELVEHGGPFCFGPGSKKTSAAPARGSAKV